MPLEYVGGVPDWAGEAANRKRLEAWYAAFGPAGLPCAVCDLGKLRQDFRQLAHHLASGKEKVTVKPPAKGGKPRGWAVNLLASPAALVDGQPSHGELLHLQLRCTRCQQVVLFDAKAIGIAV
jgi:hypothetical protein